MPELQDPQHLYVCNNLFGIEWFRGSQTFCGGGVTFDLLEDWELSVTLEQVPGAGIQS